MSQQLSLTERVAAPTPSFFKKLRMIGLVLVAASGALVAGPVAVPVIITKIAGYLAVAGGVVTAVSQTAVDDTQLEQIWADEQP